MKPATDLRPATWLFLRSAGKAFAITGQPARLTLEIAAAREEGATWRQIADAAGLPVETIEQLVAKDIKQ